MEMIPCIKCKEDMPKLRLEKYGYRVCVNCSTTGAYRAVSTTGGEGDHTWNDIQIMTPEDYDRYERSQGGTKYTEGKAEYNSFDESEE